MVAARGLKCRHLPGPCALLRYVSVCWRLESCLMRSRRSGALRVDLKDDLTVSLLQARLIELNLPINVKVVAVVGQEN